MVKFFTTLFDLFFPRQCIKCRTTGLSFSKICKECFNKIHFIKSPYCMRCGTSLSSKLFQKENVNPIICPACAKHKYPFKRMRSIMIYDDNSRDLILKFKHADQAHLADLFAQWLVLNAHDMIRESDVIIPVPLHYKRLMHRKYNQAGVLARAISKLTHRPFLTHVLHRHQFQSSQGHKGYRQRKLNVRNAFYVKNNAVIKDKNILLVDDVMTTGATAIACSRELKKAGAKRIYVLTLARTA